MAESWFSDAIDWAGNKINQTDTVQALRTKARAWAENVVRLNNTPVPASLAPQKAALLSRAKTIKTMVEKVFGAMPEFQSLGVLPAAVPVVVVAAAATAIAKWTYDYATLTKQLSEIDKMVASGVPRQEASAAVNKTFSVTGSNSVTSNIAKIVPWVVIGVGLWVYFRSRG